MSTAEKWFLEEPERLLDPIQEEFLAALWEGTKSWNESAEDWFVYLDAEAYPGTAPTEGVPAGHVLVALDLVSQGECPTSLFTLGVELAGANLRCDRVHNQLFLMPEVPTSMAMQASGEPAGLGELAAAWLTRARDTPVLRLEWDAPNEHARLWINADTGQHLIETAGYRPDLGPPARRVQVSGPPGTHWPHPAS